MKKLLLPFFILSNAVTFGQEDETAGKESFVNMPEGTIKTEISYFNISGGNWEHRDSLIKIKLKEIPVSVIDDPSASFGKGLVYITGAPFDTTGHKLTYNVIEKYRYLELIDGKPFWGTDGGIPRERIASISYRFGNKTCLLPDSALQNVFEPNFCHISGDSQYCLSRVFQSLDKKRLYIHMLNSDGAGGYEVTFVIENGKYLGRVIDRGF